MVKKYKRSISLKHVRVYHQKEVNSIIETAQKSDLRPHIYFDYFKFESMITIDRRNKTVHM